MAKNTDTKKNDNDKQAKNNNKAEPSKSKKVDPTAADLQIYNEVTKDNVSKICGQNNSGFYYDSQLNDPFLSISLHANTVKDSNGKWISGKDSGKTLLKAISDETKYPYSGCYIAEPLARCILTEDLAYSIQNNFTDLNMGNPIESLFETVKPYAPILGKIARGGKKGAEEVAKAKDFGSAIVAVSGKIMNETAPWMESAEGFLNKGLVVQGTRYAYYSGTSFNFNNLEMKYTVFSDYDINGKFYSVENYIKKLAPYVMGEYYSSTNYKQIEEMVKNENVKQYLDDYVGFQEPPGGFTMDTKNLDNVLRGTLRLNIGGMWAIENLILKNMNVVLSKVQAKDPETPGNIMPLYAEITLQLAPACTIIDTGYDRITDHKGLDEIRQASTETYKALLEKRINLFRDHYKKLDNYISSNQKNYNIIG